MREEQETSKLQPVHLESKIIDEKLFIPLNEFFISKSFDSKEIVNYILLKELPHYFRSESTKRRGNCMGFVFESYVKLVLSRFSETRDDFSATKLTSVVIRGYSFSVDKWGRIHICRDVYRDRWEERGLARIRRKNVTEIDALYEFNEKNSITPIIFEASSSQKPHRIPEAELISLLKNYIVVL